MTAPANSLYLDHTIVGAQQLTNFEFNKDREWAACRLCGAIFQSRLNSNAIATVQHLANPDLAIAAHMETIEWRENHNKLHTLTERDALNASGLMLTPEAAHRLAPYGVVPVMDAVQNEETVHALGTAPRAPSDNPQSSLTKGITVPEVRVEVETEDPPVTAPDPIPPTEPETPDDDEDAEDGD